MVPEMCQFIMRRMEDNNYCMNKMYKEGELE
jgi:hypothetical protein